MQSLTADDIGRVDVQPARRRRRLLRGIVLPRPLRRPARMLAHLDWRVPRFLGLKGTVLLFALTLIVGVFVGGHAGDAVAVATAWSGLAIDQVRITGQSQTAELEILDKLAIGPFPSLFTFDLDAAKTRIEGLPWVDDVTLRKVYPNQLNIAVRERTPFALWQDETGKLWLIDDKGTKITDAIDEGYAALPLVVGTGAATRANEFTVMLATVPALASRVRAGVLVGGRRWTVVMDSGIELMLPPENPAAALATIARLDTDSALLSREITAVDLRSGKLLLRLDGTGLAARTALVKARAKFAKAKT